MKLKIIGFCTLVFLMSLVIIFGQVSKEENYEPNEPNDFGIVLTWEREYPVDMRFYGNGMDYVEFKLSGDEEIICSGTEGKWLRLLYESMSGKEPNDPVILKFKQPTPEPNEPNDIIIEKGGGIEIEETETFTCITQLIPTWPDYIKLDKDLVIKLPERPNLWIGALRPEQYRFPKGTKIYFKEEE